MTWTPELSLNDFIRQTDRRTLAADYPAATEICKAIPIYDAAAISDRTRSEWVKVLAEGPGVFVIRGAYPDTSVVDRATEVLQAIVAEEKASGQTEGDHFAPAGANDRVWNSLQKLCLRAPAIYANYIGNAVIAMACRAWLGPGYQIATQLNVVRPGGKAQQPHRDYHLGFMSAEQMRAYPEHVHRLSPTLILQGGVAHCDMPENSGTTKLLPFSQRYLPGYIGATLPEFRAAFEERHVQLPLAKGDAIFFSPALFHAAGENRTSDVIRTVNLFQVASAFARHMESIDRMAMCLAVYPHLQRLAGDARQAAIEATAEGYPFPTNLDTDSPVGGLAPETQQDVLARAATEGWSLDRLKESLAKQQAKKQP